MMNISDLPLFSKWENLQNGVNTHCMCLSLSPSGAGGRVRGQGGVPVQWTGEWSQAAVPERSEQPDAGDPGQLEEPKYAPHSHTLVCFNDEDSVYNDDRPSMNCHMTETDVCKEQNRN